jgi:hypothetical protein
MPGKSKITMERTEGGVLASKPAIEIAFVDRTGTSWVRRSTGELVEIAKRPIDHYGIERPVTYATPVVID